MGDAKASGPMWGYTEDGEINPHSCTPSQARGVIPCRILPGHGKWVPVELIEAIEDAVHEAAIRGCSWCCPCAVCSATGNVESTIKAAIEGAV